jgi:hypothetical protein
VGCPYPEWAVRTGLIAVGAAFAVVGAGVIAAMTMTVPGPTATRTGDADVNQLAAGQARTMMMSAVATGAGSVSLSWWSSTPMQVAWYAAVACKSSDGTGWCLLGGPLANWTKTPNGDWSREGSVSGLYCLWIEDPGNVSANFSASLVESYPTLTHVLPIVPLLWTMGGGSLLVGVGGMAVYLGIFLPSGVYSVPLPAPRAPAGGPEGPGRDEREPPAP